MKNGTISRKSKFIFIVFFLLCNACVWTDNEDSIPTTTLENGIKTQYLPIDDSEYPYAGIPRVVIETENFKEIRDKENEIPAKLQIWGEQEPESQLFDLTIHGRGNSSFHAMPKYSLKLSFPEKHEFFQMPKDKKWALISYFTDKTLIRNFFVHQLDSALGSEYTPRLHFVEVYLNRKYMGIYGFCETIKVSKNRVNIPKESSFLFEKTTHADDTDPYIKTKKGNEFEIKYPKEDSNSAYKRLLQHLDSLEAIVYNKKFSETEPFSKWYDPESFYRYYWLNEFAKNVDGKFVRSTYMTWQVGTPIKMAPVWDFDLTFGNNIDGKPKVAPSGWLIKDSNIYYYILNNSSIWKGARNYWQDHKHIFLEEIDRLDSIAKILSKPSKNEYKRWASLNNTEFWSYKESYQSYEEAIDSLKSWARQRYQWIDSKL